MTGKRKKKKPSGIQRNTVRNSKQKKKERRNKKKEDEPRTYLPGVYRLEEEEEVHTILRYPLCFACREVGAYVAAGVDNNHPGAGVGDTGTECRGRPRYW